MFSYFKGNKRESAVKITNSELSHIPIKLGMEYISDDTGETVVYSHTSVVNGENILVLVSQDKMFDGFQLEYRFTEQEYLERFTEKHLMFTRTPVSQFSTIALS